MGWYVWGGDFVARVRKKGLSRGGGGGGDVWRGKKNWRLARVKKVTVSIPDLKEGIRRTRRRDQGLIGKKKRKRAFGQKGPATVRKGLYEEGVKGATLFTGNKEGEGAKNGGGGKKKRMGEVGKKKNNGKMTKKDPKVAEKGQVGVEGVYGECIGENTREVYGRSRIRRGKKRESQKKREKEGTITTQEIRITSMEGSKQIGAKNPKKGRQTFTGETNFIRVGAIKTGEGEPKGTQNHHLKWTPGKFKRRK